MARNFTCRLSLLWGMEKAHRTHYLISVDQKSPDCLNKIIFLGETRRESGSGVKSASDSMDFSTSDTTLTMQTSKQRLPVCHRCLGNRKAHHCIHAQETNIPYVPQFHSQPGNHIVKLIRDEQICLHNSILLNFQVTHF